MFLSTNHMTTIEDTEPYELIEKTAAELKKIQEIHPPKWAHFVKTGTFKERPPMKEDWWYVRTAAIFRTIYKLGPIGVSKLRTKYGGKGNRGSAPEHHYKGSGAIIRRILQQLEKAELIKQTQKGRHKGRIVTGKGQAFLVNAVKGKKEPEKKEKTPAK